MPHSTARFEPLPVLAAWDETPALRSLRLDLGPLRAAHVAPGQVVKVRAPSGEAYFALASAPSPDGSADLLVKRGGRIADEVVAAAVPGARLAVSEPFGKGFPIGAAEGRDLLLFAAGSGIAPIRALLQHVVAHRNRFRRATLFYGQRRGADFAYQGEHLDWERHGVRVVLCPSDADEAWPGVRGRVQEVARALALGGSDPGGSEAYVCGMTAMVNDVKATLREAGVPPDHVHLNF
ncbi:MAG TPA: oxidoreductase [Anaeromyxobacteraceae bacterium]|nr:oxidoreductase [Anaeromyxobacteraceae bacterium]